MKQISAILVIVLCFAIISCNNNNKQKTEVASAAQLTCDCNTKPGMVIANNNLSNERESAFKNKKEAIFNTKKRSREIVIGLANFKEILNMSINEPNATGLRAYFAQDANDNLTLVFVPTKKIGNNQIDIESTYRTIIINNSTGTLSPKSTLQDIKNMIDKYRADLKIKFENDPLSGIGNGKETKSLFYEINSLKLLQEDMNNGCLHNQPVIIPSIKFMAYGATNNNTNGQLLFHFIFNDKNGPIDFEKIFGYCIAGGDVDTGLPCPDQCNGGF